jgi:hypothetical protein
MKSDDNSELDQMQSAYKAACEAEVARPRLLMPWKPVRKNRI